MNTSRRVVQVCALLTSVLLVACSGSDDPADPDQKPPVEALGMEPDTATVPSGARTTLRAVLLRDGKRVGVVSATSWVSADPTVAQVTAPGRIRGPTYRADQREGELRHDDCIRQHRRDARLTGADYARSQELVASYWQNDAVHHDFI